MHPTNVPSRSRAFFYVPPTADIELGWLLCTPIKRLWPSKAATNFYLHIFRRLICRHQTMAKCTPRRGRAPSSMSLPWLTLNSVGCCVPQLNGGYLRPQPHPPLSYFLSIYFDNRTDDTAHPHAFHLSRASSLTPPSSLTPILFHCCVLICKTAATFKAQAPPIPLFSIPMFSPL
jgi:hypothetical protein